MFTGIVQCLAEVAEVTREGTLSRLQVVLGSHAEGLELGASVAINGTCLTVTEVGNAVCFDVIHETLGLTNLGSIKPGDQVNVERSFRVGDEVGGHILSGHICDTVTVAEIIEGDLQRDLVFDVAPDWMKYLHHKGFVALDGASLTIAWVDHDKSQFAICLIPETIERTTLGRVVVGDRVNLEIDAQTQGVVDTVERLVSSPAMADRFRELLATHG